MEARGRRERRMNGSLPAKPRSQASYRARRQKKASRVTFSTALVSLGVLTAGMGTVAAAVYSVDPDENSAKTTEGSRLEAQQMLPVDVSSSGNMEQHFADVSLKSAEVEKPSLKSTVSNPDIINRSKEFAQRHLQEVGYPSSEFQCLDTLYVRESDWRHTATNGSSGAYGIAQALPASKMETVASDWQTNPETQIIWGVKYIKARYGSPCGAMAFWNANHWY